MSPPPAEPAPGALSPHASARGRGGARAHGASPTATLWEAIRRTREALERRQARVAALTDRFAATIRPREEAFTASVCRLTDSLVRHHEGTALEDAERTLLGLWIDENLRSLASHPFAPRERTEAVTRRWRGHLGRAVHPLDIALASLDTDPAGADRATDRHEGLADATRRAQARRSGWRTRGPSARPAGGGGARRGGKRAAGGEATAETIDRDMRALSARLFRRLARALHPDREQDEARKRDKHRLMSDCLRARDERDIDTLLSLYVEHVGELPEALADGGADALEGLLRDQLHQLQRRLRRARGGDALQAMILDRYAVDDPAESERRFGEHARALDAETARAEATARRVTAPVGLREALAERRERELDRLWIDEMTGAGPG